MKSDWRVLFLLRDGRTGLLGSSAGPLFLSGGQLMTVWVLVWVGGAFTAMEETWLSQT